MALPYPEPLMTTEQTHSPDFDFENPAKRNARCHWYRSKLGQYSEVINNTAKAEKVPPELLMAVILNELSDIGFEDVEQDQAIAWTQGDFNKFKLDSSAGYMRLGAMITGRPVSQWSLGIAQIQPATVLRYNAIPVSPQVLQNRELTEFVVAFSLLNRAVSIQVAARVIKGILKDIERQQRGLWISQFIRPDARFSADNPYESLNPHASRDPSAASLLRRRNLIQMVDAIYNTDSILRDNNPARIPNAARGNFEQSGYPNAGLHSLNAAEIAEDLHTTGFCGMPIVKWETIQRPGSTTQTVRYDRPLWGGERLDGCLLWATQCGQPAADQFCRMQQRGFQSAAKWAIEQYVPRTKIIGDGKLCETGRNINCGAFTFIECK